MSIFSDIDAYYSDDIEEFEIYITKRKVTNFLTKISSKRKDFIHAFIDLRKLYRDYEFSFEVYKSDKCEGLNKEEIIKKILYLMEKVLCSRKDDYENE